jgi:hypothetical protein
MKTTFTFDDVRRIGLALPGVEESTTFHGPSLKIRGKLLTSPPINQSAEPVSIVVHVSLDQRQELITQAPETYYVTDHYVNYPAVLVRLSHIDADALRGLLRMSWQFVTQENSARTRQPRKPKSSRLKRATPQP